MRATIVLAIVSLVAGCAHAPDGAKRRDRRTVRIFYAPPSLPYAVLGTTSVEDEDMEEVVEDLQDAVIDLDGDAALVTFVNGAPATSGFGAFRKLETKIQMTADVIRFRRAQ